MKICRLKIIRANILENNIDSPQIIYVSQNKNNKKLSYFESEKKLANDDVITPFDNNEEIIVSKDNNDENNIKLQDIIKSDRDKKINDNKNNMTPENYKINEDDEIKYRTDLKSSYPYAIMDKRKDLDSSLKYIFKERLTRSRINSKKNSNLSLPKLRTANLFYSKNYKNAYSRPNLSKSLSHSVNKNTKLKNKTSKRIKNNASNNLVESNNSSFWRVLEKNELNYGQIIDYKELIDELLTQECNLVKQKEELIQLYEEKIKSLKELNSKLLSEKNFVLDREDELNGELILLRNQYENLFRNFKQKYKTNENTFNNQQKEIDEKSKKLNTELKNGELILITRPYNIMKLTSEEIKYITYLLRAIFFSHHILDTDNLIDLIWKFDKNFQTIYFLVKEFCNYFNLNTKENETILINYIYSFCKKYDYMHINEFKSKFKKKIGNIKVYNKYIQISKLLHFHKRETDSLMKLIKKKDTNSSGIISFNQFKQLFYNVAFAKNITKEEQDETMEFIIYCMKKNCNLKIKKSNDQEEPKKSDNLLYDLFYLNLNDYLDEYNSKKVSNPYKLMRNYMEQNNIVSAEKLLRPIIIPPNVIKKDSKEFIDEIILNKYLRQLGIIRNNESILLNTIEEELVDINEFINDIYTKDFIDKNKAFEENNKKVNNMIDDVFNNILNKNK